MSGISWILVWYICALCASNQPLVTFFEVFGVNILKPPAVTLHHTLILGCNAGTLSSWVNFGGECWESSDPDSVLRSYISRQIKPGLQRGQQDEDSTYTTSHCPQTALSWQHLLLGRSCLIIILMSQNALFSLGQLCVVWKFQSHGSIPPKSSTERHFKCVMWLNVTLLSASSVCCVCGCQLWYRHRYFWDWTVETEEEEGRKS